MKVEYLGLILACALVTALPKIFPLVFLKGKRLSKNLVEFLNVIPYTSLAILIIRGIFHSDPKLLMPTLVSAVICIVVAYIKENISVTIISGVVSTFILLTFFG